MFDFLQIPSETFLDRLSPDVRQAILKAGVRIRYEDGQMLHGRGDDKPGLSIILSGAVQAGIHGRDGSFVLALRMQPGETFGEFTLFAGLPRTHDVLAIGQTEICQIPAAAFMRLYETHSEIATALLSVTLVRSHMAFEMLDAIRRLPLRERTAKFIIMLMQSTNTPDAFACRQADLAFTLGVSRMSLSTALRQLSDLGLVQRGYGAVIVPDAARMRTWVRNNCSPS